MNHSLKLAITVLQSDVNPLEEKIQALRAIKAFVEQNDQIDVYLRRGINQVVLDNVLKIILREDKSVNPFVKQLVRVELYTILGQFLESQALFGSDVMKNMHNLPVEDDQSTLSVDVSTPSSQKNDAKPRRWLPSSSAARAAGKGLKESVDLENSSTVTPKGLHARGSFLWGKRRKLTSLEVSERDLLQSRELSKSQPLLIGGFLQEKRKQPKHISKGIWKPRSSVLFSGDNVQESFVPGADPSNFIETDRKLGYQKPRMWFPIPKLGLAAPDKFLRSNGEGTNFVVEQYLNMRSLASYVGDLVVPFSSVGQSKLNRLETLSSHRHLSPADTMKLSATSGASKALVDPQRFPTALKEAMQLWSPVLNTHIPKAGGKKRFLQITDEDSSQGRQEDRFATRPAVVVRQFHEEDVEDDESDHLQRFKNQMLKGLNVNKLAKLYHKGVSNQLEKKGQRLATSIASLQEQIHATMQAHYATFHPKYVLLIEGRNAKARKLIKNMIRIFLKCKKRGQLALAFGMLKIGMIKAQSAARQPQYARIASCNMVARWVSRQRQRNYKKWLEKWKESVSWLIFLERNQATAILQTLFRRWRDRRKFIAMHKLGPYNGILSDIALAPHRYNVKYTIPRVIRDERRIYWVAATLVQSLYRCWIECKDYFEKKRRIILLQSICRMWPKYRWFQRLKATTVRCQAWMRRTIKHRRYKILRKATIIVQKYVRRYQAIMLKLRKLDEIWRGIEEQLVAAIRIQCRYRIRLARKRLRKRRFAVAMKEYAALVIQRNWYRCKNAFHTFFLMCALREREQQDIALEKLSTIMGRNYRARVIQRKYKERYNQRIISNVIKVQCWLRGRLGYNLVDILRKQRWASRKLRHWVRARLRFRHRTARRIQRWWWKLKKLRLLKHLWYKHRILDRDESKALSEAKHTAASRIQAHVKGTWDRRWVKRHCAALMIQKNWRFLNGIKKWKHMKRGRINKSVKKIVDRMIERAVLRRTADLVAKHSEMMIKPQALARGFIVRATMLRVRRYAVKLGLAAVRVQRFWRQSGAMTKAVEEVMARKRMENNPFKNCSCLHEILHVLRDQCNGFYSSVDPRVGMKMSSFLYRMGLGELEIFFPKKGYTYATDGHKVTVEKLTEWYYAYHNKLKEKEKANKDNSASVAKRVKPAPTPLFQVVVNVLKVPLYPRHGKQSDRLQQISAIPEHSTPMEAFNAIKKMFLRRFGKNLQTRAVNFARDILEMTYPVFNNYQAYGANVLTLGQISRAMQIPQDSTLVLKALDELRKQAPSQTDERKWDLERLRTCSAMLQLAFDRAISILPPCAARSMMEKVVARVASYRRKVGFLLQKSKRAQALKLKAEAAKSSGKRKPGAVPAAVAQVVEIKRIIPDAPVGDVADDAITPLIPANRMDRRITPAETLDLVFRGQDEDFELDFQASICKIYMTLAERLLMVTVGIQGLKNSWANKAVRRAVAAERKRLFLESVTSKYLQEQQENNVQAVWKKFKRIETSKKKLESIMQAVELRRWTIEQVLSYIPRYHIYTYYDENGYMYYVDERGFASYEMPVYSFKQFLACERIQSKARTFIEGARKRRLKKEEDERREIELAEQKLIAERRKALKAMEILVIPVMEEVCQLKNNKPSVKLANELVNKHYNAHKKGFNGHKLIQSEDDLEHEVAWKYRYNRNVEMRCGTWALLHTSGSNVAHNSFNSQNNYEPSIFHSSSKGQLDGYDVVVLFRIKPSEELCDVRTVKGKIIRGVTTKRIRHMNYDINTAVEARYKYRKLFYRGCVKHISMDSLRMMPVYKIQYEDSEVEDGLGRDAVRPTPDAVLSFLEGRTVQLNEVRLMVRRQGHFANLAAHRKLVQVTALVDKLLQSGEASLSQAIEVDEKDIDNDIEEIHQDGGQEGDAQDGEEAKDGAIQEEKAVELDKDALDEAGELMTHPVDINASLQGEPGRAPKSSLRAKVAKPKGPKKIQQVTVRYSKVHINVTKAPLLYNWSMVVLPGDDVSLTSNSTLAFSVADPAAIRFVNELTGDEVSIHEPPFYNAREIHLIRKIQQRWMLFKAVKNIRQKALTLPIQQTIQDSIDKGSKLAFIGYKTEGITVMQTLARSGYGDIAQTIQDHYHALRKPLLSLTLDGILNFPKEEYEKLGIIQAQHVRELKEFQTVFKKLSVLDREKKLVLFNYYSDPYDMRSIQECIQASIEIMMKKFTRAVKAGQTRTRQACQQLVDQSMFPHSHLQIETYLRKYADKAELIRDSVMELTNRATVPTYVEETLVWRIYHHCALRISQVLRSMRLKRLRLEVLDVIRRAEAMVSGNHAYGQMGKHDRTTQARSLCSGPEAKGAWMIRRDVFEYLLEIVTAAGFVQRNVRCYLLRKTFKAYLKNRIIAVDKLQRNVRRWAAYRRSAVLRKQLSSPWEQLWDSRYNRLYYYNLETNQSQYEEPPDRVYRPLIRDKNSAALIQAWPQIRTAALSATLPLLTLGPDEAPPSLVCNICHMRKCIKYCLDCRSQEGIGGAADSLVTKPVSYCLPCYVIEHPETDKDKAKHRCHLFEDPQDDLLQDRAYLRCCMCAEPATRKCLGPLDDEQIDFICKQLQKVPVSQWEGVLQDAHVGGERRITALMEQLLAEATGHDSVHGLNVNTAPMQLNAVRSAMERMRAECDECYCKSCYKQVHSNGKRAAHRWQGFQSKCRVCAVCTSTAAESACHDCACDYCESCFKVFHSMGKKRKHRKEVIYEELLDGQGLCFICNRRAADKCLHEKCNKMACESCFEFKHKAKCPFNTEARAQSPAGRRITTSLSPVHDRSSEPKCVVCGEIADKRCQQCGDLYCSVVYMGNAGCFAKFHSKGNRAAHTTDTLMNEKLSAARIAMKSKVTQDKMIKQRLGY